MRSFTFTLILIASLGGLAHSQDTEEQVELALRALPVPYRDGASVVTWDENGKARYLRQGTNGWTCQADDPSHGISIQCFFETWKTLRMRFFELLAQGTPRREAWSICEAEVKEGKIRKPTRAIGFELVGTTSSNAQPQVLVFIPYATGEEMGLPTVPDNHHPWLMAAGRINAHIMAH